MSNNFDSYSTYLVRFFTRLIFGSLVLAGIFFSLSCSSAPVASNTPTGTRIVSIGGAITETVYALGAESGLVGTDTSSVYPVEATKLPQVGYQRTISAEGIISLRPTLVLISADTGPPAAIQQIESAGIKTARVDGGNTIDGTKQKIRQIAELVGKKDKGEELVKTLESDIAAAQKAVAERGTSPKVVFIFSRGAGAAQVGGTGTQADAMIKLAGGQNAVTGFEQYKPLTPEAMVAAQPDVILLPSRGLDTMGGVDAILAIPGVADTPVGKNKKIISVDDVLLLGFSPRLGIGIKELAEKLK